MENLIITDVFDEEQNVKIEGYSGRWSALEKTEYDGAVYYWYENNRYGDATCYLVCEWVDGILMQVFETYDGLEQCLIDEDII